MAQEGRQLAAEVVRDLRRRGFQGWFVGGCVRDLLLGREPGDYDVATDARPDQVLSLFPRAEQVGAHFGVVLVKADGFAVEVATFRSDLAYADGRHPEGVVFETDPRKDAQRRDFTINALFLDPIGGEVLDFVGGRADLAHGVVRAIGDPARRFAEDHLRMLRAIRFAARLGFSIDPATFATIGEQRAAILRISAERIRDELVRILTEGGARRGFELLDSSGLLGAILPEIAAFHGVEQPPEFHPEGDVWIHTMMMLEELPAGCPATLALGVLLHDVGKPGTFRVAGRIRFDGHVELGVEIAGGILARLRFSNQDTEQVLALVANHMRFKDAGAMRASTLKRFLSLPRFDEHLELHRLDCLSSHRDLGTYLEVRRKLRELPAEVLRPPRLLGGDDLIAEGCEPGPRFAEILRAVEDAQLEGEVRDKQEALEWVRRRYLM